jgi:ubiquinone/menaquinone biosynthesis C-methylase UbiE
MSKFTVADIKHLYAAEAEKHGIAGTSTIQDMRTRELEIHAVSSYLRDKLNVLEVGCGNGYMAAQLVQHFDITLDAFDFSEEMIALARKQLIANPRGHVTFFMGDVLALNRENAYDLIFSVRCLQNLTSWELQKHALRNIARALRLGGDYVMDECFWTGLNNLNEARAELDLEQIPESWHNCFFHEGQTVEYMESLGCAYQDQNAFLSGYYFGSRVLLPALMPKGKKVASTSRLNDYFVSLPAAGDFCPMKILRFRRQR